MSDGLVSTSTARLRSAEEEETLTWIAARFGAAGITRLADITRLDVVGIPTWQAIRPAAITLSVSQGKGRTHTAAQLAAAMEAVEHASWERFEPEPEWGSTRKLAEGARVVDPTDIADIMLPAVDAGAVIPWCRALDLATKENVWVPYDAVCVQRGGTHRKGPRISYASTNGLAAGSSIAEATVHAILELVERDAHACAEFLMEHNAVPRPQIDLDSFAGPAVRKIVDRVQTAGLEVLAFWNVAELGIPCCSAYIVDDHTLGLTNIGHGAHLDPEQALERAITEAAQGRITMISGAREDNLRADYRYLWEVGTTLALRARHETALSADSAPFSWGPAIRAPSPDAALAALLARLRECGFVSPLRVDMTEPHIGVPVAKVFIPGLCGYHRTLAGRLDRHAAWRVRYGGSVGP